MILLFLEDSVTRFILLFCLTLLSTLAVADDTVPGRADNDITVLYGYDLVEPKDDPAKVSKFIYEGVRNQLSIDGFDIIKCDERNEETFPRTKGVVVDFSCSVNGEVQQPLVFMDPILITRLRMEAITGQPAISSFQSKTQILEEKMDALGDQAPGSVVTFQETFSTVPRED